jgi:GNAT superfamily N-acetyltransferase/SAM-dependent methyltransferase
MPNFMKNKSNADEITRHLLACDIPFLQSLKQRVEINDYAQKIHLNADRFEAWHRGELVGLLAVYSNSQDKSDAFLTSISVLPFWQKKGIASYLLDKCIASVSLLGFNRLELEVSLYNNAAKALYEKHGFYLIDQDPKSKIAKMAMNTNIDMTMSQSRDYNAESSNTSDHKYAYRFDFDVMHPLMLRSFEPFFRTGNLLELGSYKGDFTSHLLKRFSDITCVEASNDALLQARTSLGDKASYINGLFEQVTLPCRYNNIVLTHVLEHLDDPIKVLHRINHEWLAEGGRLFLVCPNANAPSRQIAVKMGLISHNSAVTSAEKEHGHRCTYSFDTLERDAVAAGLNIVHRSGIFFKALANFQWDRLLNTDIISPEYLDGCYKLGLIYPDLCASIFLMCESGASD